MALLDAYGRPVRQQKLTVPLAEGGMTGIRQTWAGSAASGLTPVKLASILRACDQGELREFLILAEEMEERDPHYFSVLGTRKRAISGIMPQVEPASDSARDVEIAEAVREEIAEHDGFADLVEDLLDALGKGFSVVEIDWARSASRWTPARFDHRDPRFFVFDRETRRELLLMTDAAPVEGEPLEPFKFITHRSRMKSGLTYRGGLARVVAFGWMCKAYTFKDWMSFIETYGLPLRIGRYGPEATKEDVAKLYQAVANIGTDAAAVLPKSMEITFEKGLSLSGPERIFETFARYIDEQISKAVLGQTMTADSGSSQAQATVHNEVRHDIAASDARAVAGAINRDLVRAYVDLNFGVQGVYPRLTLPVAEPEDIKTKIEGAAKLMERGLRFKATELRGKLGFSDPEQGDEIVGGAPVPPAVPPAVPPGAANRARSLALNRAQAEDLLTGVEEDMLSDWEEVGSDMEAAIAGAIDGADSYEAVLERLPGALRQMPSALLIDTLVKGMFKARAVGDAQDD
jgi:phage gp29-like protein